MAMLLGLDRGLRALQIISARPAGVSIAALADALAVDRAVAYRIVDTLEAHDLAVRGEGRRVRLGAGAVVLANRFQPQLLHAAAPVLQELADATSSHAFLTVEQGAEDCIPVLGAEPALYDTPLQVTYRIGMRHRLDRGANGIAILALRSPRSDEPEEVARARDAGYSVTSGHLQQGATGVAAGFLAPGPLAASVGIVGIAEAEVEFLSRLVVGAAARLAALTATSATDG
jgi:DNA-binding IclR family transcriptional regulator